MGDLSSNKNFELMKMMAMYAPERSPPGSADLPHPLAYRIWATVIHVAIFILGVSGNVILVFVIRKTKSLQSSTYCYLNSLAVADLMVLLSAVPEAVVSHHIGWRWISGQTGCSLMVFFNFLGINAGSLSILAFTVDRYISFCRPLLILKVCNWKCAKKIVAGLWIFALLYCGPWLALTEVKPDPDYPKHQICDFRVSKEVYQYWFIADIVIFYICPLIVAAFVYTIIGLILRRSISSFRVSIRGYDSQESPMMDNGDSDYRHIRKNTGVTSVNMQMTVIRESVANHTTNGDVQVKLESADETMMLPPPTSLKYHTNKLKRSRTRVFRILVIIVVLFAVTWLPYRGVLVYNSFSSEPWFNLFYLFFAKTCIYLNCAINPYLYNIMSRRFRVSCGETLTCQPIRKDY